MSESDLRAMVAAVLLSGYIQSNMTEAYNYAEGLKTLIQYTITATDALLAELAKAEANHKEERLR